MDVPTDSQIRDVLKEIDDPELGINIIDLGLVYAIDVSGGIVHIKMTMTTPACPLHAYLSAAAEEAIRARFPGITQVEIKLVWDPPWEPAKMSPAAKRQLGWQ